MEKQNNMFLNLLSIQKFKYLKKHAIWVNETILPETCHLGFYERNRHQNTYMKTPYMGKQNNNIEKKYVY